MSALAEALVAAQRRALSALEKAYVAGIVPAEQVSKLLDSIGLSDKVDKERLLQALMIVKDLGAQVPGEPTNGTAPKADEPATDAQMALVKRLCGEKNQPVPDPPLTKAQAHEIIDTLKAGTYDAGRWSVPF